jgi:glucose/arabinose dehydrogenase
LNDDPNNPTVYIGDVGWTQWEEVNVGTGGENFGWPAFEGGSGVSQQTGGYRNLAVIQDYYATNPDVTAPAHARLHSNGGRAIVMGDFVGSVYGSVYDNTLIFTDIGDQILRAARFNSAGEITSVTAVSQNVGFIVDIETGLDGFLYYVDITGSVGRLDFV